MKKNNFAKGVSRRDFLKTSAAVSLAAFATRPNRLFAAGSDAIRVGLVGCGGRGTGAAINCIESSKGVEIVAMGDLFRDQLDSSIKNLKKQIEEKRIPRESLKVTEETCFTGFDAYRNVINSDAQLIIFATPPHFRPAHLRAAVEAGKHVFMEKPVAVDPIGIRSVIETSELAKRKNLAIVAGTQRRHQDHYLEIMKRIHNGDIGEVVSGQCYWNQGALWVERAKKNMINHLQNGWSGMEFQCRNWLFYTWLSGDHIVEQHVHNLDVMNWAMGGHPVKAMGMGGRQVRTGPQYGNIFDHFAIEFEYANGGRIMSMCRQIEGTSSRVSERVVGTKGSTYTDSANGYIEGDKPFKYEDSALNPYVQEHGDLIASIRNGQPLNEGRRIAESTMTAIMGRMSAYTGRELKWDWAMKSSVLDLTPPKYDFTDLPEQVVAQPGQTELI